MKLALLLLALLGGLWGARSLGDGDDAWGGGGEHASFHDDGTPRSRVTMSGGDLDGPAHTWHVGGRPESEGRYARGEREGAWRFWHADGSLDAQRSGVYQAGVRVAPLAD